MDNAGDWLYIVFLIIAGISSLFGSKNKKKRPKQILGQPDREIVTNEDNVPDKGFWEILEEMQNPKPAGNRLVVPSTEEEIPLTDIEFDNAAELRKAVIYTEILNRKY